MAFIRAFAEQLNVCRGAQRLGSCISVSGALLSEALIRHTKREGVAPTPVLITHGDQDPDLPTDLIRRTATQLRESGLSSHLLAGLGHTEGLQICGLNYNDMPQLVAIHNAGCSVEVHEVPNKAGGMISGPTEMRVLMAFWARHLQRAAPVRGRKGEHIVEITQQAEINQVKDAMRAQGLL